MGSLGARKAGSQRLAGAAVGLLFVLGGAVFGAVTACEYTDDAVRPVPVASSPQFSNPVLPRDPAMDMTVEGEQLDAWARDVLPTANGQPSHTGSGLLPGGTSWTEETAPLSAGSYAVSLACRGARRVSFVVKDGGMPLIELGLQCGTSRVNVVQLAEGTVLAITVSSSDKANFAYRVSRL